MTVVIIMIVLPFPVLHQESSLCWTASRCISVSNIIICDADAHKAQERDGPRIITSSKQINEKFKGKKIQGLKAASSCMQAVGRKNISLSSIYLFNRNFKIVFSLQIPTGRLTFIITTTLMIPNRVSSNRWDDAQLMSFSSFYF